MILYLVITFLDDAPRLAYMGNDRTEARAVIDAACGEVLGTKRYDEALVNWQEWKDAEIEKPDNGALILCLYRKLNEPNRSEGEIN